MIQLLVCLELPCPFSGTLGPGMAIIVHFLKTVVENMYINPRGRNIRMSKHFLNILQLGAVFQEMECKGMAQRVRRDILINFACSA